jgi:hypothetical protein
MGLVEPFFAPEFFVNGCEIEHVGNTCRRYIFFSHERPIGTRSDRIARIVKCRIVIPTGDAIRAWEECGADFGRVALQPTASPRLHLM